ncbi:hypothetical protein M413DRAFT_346761 [Hebeloma cylindrosporum]|uniref:Uncharacterized protein n=1 Tax=Hebeloma cylindrosporum TaxID=76867 RepID=A0A0C2XCI2_HEBCY|nr:hypothetical protein M413DRAFT_346761 [Hebeloma cylindrosporum h7]
MESSPRPFGPLARYAEQSFPLVPCRPPHIDITVVKISMVAYIQTKTSYRRDFVEMNNTFVEVAAAVNAKEWNMTATLWRRVMRSSMFA